MNAIGAMVVSAIVGCGLSIALAAGATSMIRQATPEPVDEPLVGAVEPGGTAVEEPVPDAQD